jgi:geranylgeranyl pyrophosphate synthase
VELENQEILNGSAARNDGGQQSLREKTLMEIFNRYAPYLAECRTAISSDLANAPQARILSEYFERGKMLRPLLVFLSASVVGGDPSQAIPAAQALEMLHGASLIHDDIIDGAKERRGRPPLHHVIGVGPAVVLGDYLILRACAMFAKIKSNRALEALEALTRCAEECCRGQIEELVSESGDPEETYFSIVRGKTASQFVAAATVGAMIGAGSREDVEALRAFALNIGISFQVRDDELDLTGEATTRRKRAGGSFHNARPTLPIIYLGKYGSKAVYKRYRQIQKQGGTRSELLALLGEEGILERLKQVKEQHLSKALEALSRFGTSEVVKAMTALAHHIIVRDS